MIAPCKSDDVSSISGVSHRLTICRHLEGHGYPQNGNVHRLPTPQYRYYLRVDGVHVDQSSLKRVMRSAARVRGAEYVAEMDERSAR